MTDFDNNDAGQNKGNVQRTEAMKARTKAFAVRIVTLFRSLPRTAEAKVIGNQLLRSGTSVGANYRAVCRARSDREFAAKLGVVVEEADESVFWMELLIECGIVSAKKLSLLLVEGNELLAIFGASARTVHRRMESSKREHNEK